MNHFNQTFTGWMARTFDRQEIDTGGCPNGRVADNKRINTSGDFGVVADISKYFSVSDSFDYWNFRLPATDHTCRDVGGTATSISCLTPTQRIPPITHTPATTLAPDPAISYQKIESNTILATVTVCRSSRCPEAGASRTGISSISMPTVERITWHQNGSLVVLSFSHRGHSGST